MDILQYLHNYLDEHAQGSWNVYFEDKIYKVRCVLCDHVLALPVHSGTGIPKISNCNVHYKSNKNCMLQRATMKVAGGGASPTEDAVGAEDKRYASIRVLLLHL